MLQGFDKRKSIDRLKMVKYVKMLYLYWYYTGALLRIILL